MRKDHLQHLAITSLAQFEHNRDRWDALYEADTNGAQLFLSSAWLHAHLALVPGGWTIHVLTEGDEFVAALPIAPRPIPHRLLPVARELRFPTDPFADYQGMLARPSHERAAIAAFAELLASARWERLALRDVRDQRIGEIVELLAAGRGVRVTRTDPVTCYQIDLPETYDAFLERLSKPTRRATKRGLKAMAEELPHLHVSMAPDGDPEQHIDAVVGMNSRHWETSTIRRRRLGELYRAAYRAGIARFVVIWDGTRPIGVGAALLDAATSTYGFALVAHDDEYARMSPGKAVLALLVQDAIALGYRTFDFLRGEGDYKQSYATRTSSNHDYELVRAGPREAALRAVTPLYGVAKRLLVRSAMKAR